MTIETQWYCDHDAKGNPPACRRLSRLPINVAWDAAITLAIEYAAGRAGYRQTHNSKTREATWYAPGFQPASRSKASVASDWWLIPMRVEVRLFAIYRAAVDCEMRANGGRCEEDAIVRRLETWRSTGAWRSVAAKIAPRHYGPPPKKRKNRRAKKRTKRAKSRQSTTG